jgi:hypothetical protein
MDKLLTDYGPLGILVFLIIGAIGAIWKAYLDKDKQLMSEKDRRYDDLKEINSHVILTLDNFNDTVKTIFIEKTHEKKAND